MQDNILISDEARDLAASEYADLGARVWKNLFHNLRWRSKAYPVKALFGQFTGTPAIVCGAGPSLAGALPLIEKLSDRALVLGGGSALQTVGHIVHLGACIDPEHTLRNFSSAPLIYQDRVEKEVLATASGPFLWAPDNGNFSIERWFNQEEAPFDGGWNVATFCIAIAHALGCNPIILAGVDLSMPGECKQEWIQAARWIEEFAERHPETQIITIAEYASFLGEPRPLQERIDALLQQHALDVSDSLETFSASLQRTQLLCHNLLQILAEIHPKKPQGNASFLLTQVELEEELAYQHLLRPFWEEWKERLPNPEEPLTALLFFQRVLDTFCTAECSVKKTYYENGVLESESSYNGALLHGPSRFYSAESVLLSETQFVLGKREGRVTRYYPTGVLCSLQNYSRGVEEGKQEFFYPSGQLKSVLMYKKGLLDGMVSLFGPDSSRKRELIFVEGKRVHGT